jgi:hypothetical protein
VITGVLAAFGAGCGRPAASNPPDSPPPVVATAVRAEPEPAPAPISAAAADPGAVRPGPAVRAIDFEQLKVLFPEVDGWTKEEVWGESLTVPVTYSRAQARYRRDDTWIDLEITDTALSPLLLEPLTVFLAPNYSERWDGGFRQDSEMGGQPGFEEWNADARRAEITAVVRRRFIVSATGYEVSDLAPVRRLAAAIDLSPLASIR